MECIKCKSKKVMGVEYFEPTGKTIPFEHQYDGVSEYQCLDCKTRWGRWSGKILKDDDYEKKFG